MFYSCSDITEIYFENFNTSQAQDMGAMFMYCSSMTSIDSYSCDTSKVLSMQYV